MTSPGTWLELMLCFCIEQGNIILKWSNTLQVRKHIKTIHIPVLGFSPFCPVASLKPMFQQNPADRNQPLFLILRANKKLITLTDSVARKHMKEVSNKLQIVPHLTFHAFRRGGCSWAFHKGVAIHHIMAQETWTYDCILWYIASQPSLPSLLTRTFRQHLYM